jgi:hypothetical protein
MLIGNTPTYHRPFASLCSTSIVIRFPITRVKRGQRMRPQENRRPRPDEGSARKAFVEAPDVLASADRMAATFDRALAAFLSLLKNISLGKWFMMKHVAEDFASVE